jgi:copper chaperone CopZ
MRTILLALLIASGISADAQVSKVSLQASGLTCSMCSKAVLTALQKVPFVEKVQVDIKNQRYNITFRENASLDFDRLTGAVQDAGFSVASFDVTASVEQVKLEKDQHVLIGGQYFHFLNASGQLLTGNTVITIVDKAYTSSKNYKKYSVLSKMKCVQTGHAAECCKTGKEGSNTRIYHAII